ncbi:MAG: polyphenol oxidase family protein [Acidimicrobiia bacterium]
MIRPFPGAAFTAAPDGDLRGDQLARARVSELLGVPSRWATVEQVHGGKVVEATGPVSHGPADALFTTRPGLPLAVFSADCVTVVLTTEGEEPPQAVGVAHAGWRGLAAGVIGNLRRGMLEAGAPPVRAAVSPSIGPCCFEVGPEVAALFPGPVRSTSWGAASVDLWALALRQLEGLEVWESGMCSHHQPGWFSHRRDATIARSAAIAWRP